jgi:hypothetical protein
MSTSPTLIVGSGAVGSGSGSNGADDPNELAQLYQNLLSGAANIEVTAAGRTLVMTSGAIGLAGAIQAAAKVETSQEVAADLAMLGSIAAYCTANNIGIIVDANLTNAAKAGDGTNALVNQWATAAAAANLPIVGVEDVQEIGISQPVSSFANFASIEANAVRTIAVDYAKANSSYHLTAASLMVGDMEGGSASNVPNIGAWWAAYNSAAAQAGVQAFSFVTADVGWNAPWLAPEATPVWQEYLRSLSSLAASYNVALHIDMQGVYVDTTGDQTARQVEQNAAALGSLAKTGALNVSALQFQSWTPVPTSAGLVNCPSSQSNIVAEVGSTYSLYATGSITATGLVSLTAPPQALVSLGTAMSLPLSLKWSAADLQAGNRIAMVLIDQSGTLAATAHGSGTVSRSAPNILVLGGNATDLTAELSSLTVTEQNAGPDTIDVQTFGIAGRLTDSQINLLALPSGPSVGKFDISATSNAQGWLSTSSLINSGHVVTQETLNWSTTGVLSGTISGASPGQSTFVKQDAVHMPLAEYGVQNATTINGVAINAVADVNDPLVDNANAIATAGGAANNPNQHVPVGLGSWLAGAFDPAGQTVLVTVQSTTNTFDPVSGQLLSSMDTFAPSPMTVVNMSGTAVPNPFATQFNNGGSQIIEFNTGNNPGWNPTWSNQFNSATLTYDGAGHLVEEFLQGSDSNPAFSIDDVFDPANGQLWEEFQSSAPPPVSSYSSPVSNFVTGPLYITEFNTGDNPNWDYLDWGKAAPSDTEVWSDYFAMQNMRGFFLNSTFYSYAYQFTNGSTLDLLNLPGTINVDLNALGQMVINSQTLSTGLTGLNAVDAGGATGPVTLTGLKAGKSTLIGGDGSSTINGFGQDTIIAGAGLTTINAGGTNSTILMVGSTGIVTVNGSANVISVVSSATKALINGSGNTVTAAAGVSLSELTGRAGLTVNGSGVTTTAAAGDTITINGTADVINFVNGGTLNTGGGSSATLNGNNTVVWMNAAGGTVTAVGSNDTVTAGANAVVTVIGNYDVVGTWAGDTINVTGQNNYIYSSNVSIAAGAATTGLQVLGNSNTLSAVSGDSMTLYGTGEVVNASGITINTSSTLVTVSVNGNNNKVSASIAGDTVNLVGTGNTVTAGAGVAVTELTPNATLIVNGNGVTVTGASGDSLTVSGSGNLINRVNGGILSQTGGLAVSLTGSNVASQANAAGCTLTAAGNSNTLNLLDGDVVNLTGTGDVLNGSNITINAGSVAGTFAVNGANNKISAASNRNTVMVAGSGNTVTAAAGAAITELTANATLMVNGNGATVTGASGDVIYVAGSADVINLAEGGVLSLSQGKSATLNGSNVVGQIGAASCTLAANGNNNTLNLAAGDLVTVSGIGDVLNGSGLIVSTGQAGTSFQVAGMNNKITASAPGSSVTLNGSGDIVTATSGVAVTDLAKYAYLTVNGNGVVTTVAAGDTVTVNGTADVLNFVNGGTLYTGAGSAATLTGSNMTVWMNAAGGTLTAVGSNDTVTAGANAVVTVIGNCDVVGTWAGDIINVTGQGDVVYSSNVGITAGAATTGLLVFGNNNTLSASSGDSMTLYGTGEVVNASGVTITTASAAAVALNGNLNTANMGAASSLTLIGNSTSNTITGSGTLTNGGSGNSVSLTPKGTLKIATNASLAANISGSGTIDLASGTLVCQTAGNQGSTFLLDGSVTLDFRNAITGGATMRFVQPNATLETEATGAFGASISGFTSGDTLDASSIVFGLKPSDLFTLAAGSGGGTLSVTDGVHSASFALIGSYVATGFHLAGDGHGGTAITYT